MYLISKILFGTPSTLSDLDDNECPNQFELLGNGGKRMKERKLVYSRVPKEQICPEEQGCAHGHQKQNCAAVPEASINEEIKKVVAMFQETFAPYQRAPVPPPGVVVTSKPCCDRTNKINGRSPPCCPIHPPIDYRYCKECSRINVSVAAQHSNDGYPYCIIVDPKTFLSGSKDAQSRPSSSRIPNWSPQSPNCRYRQLAEDTRYRQLEELLAEDAKRISAFVNSPLPDEKDLPSGYSKAPKQCCTSTAQFEGRKGEVKYVPRICHDHSQVNVFRAVVKRTLPSRLPHPQIWPVLFLKWNSQAVADAEKIVEFLMSPVSDKKNLPAGYRVKYWPCCNAANKHPVGIPVPGHPDQIINVAYCPRDKQFHIYRDNIHGRHVVWNPSQKSGSDLTETARPKSPSGRPSRRSLIYSRSRGSSRSRSSSSSRPL